MLRNISHFLISRSVNLRNPLPVAQCRTYSELASANTVSSNEIQQSTEDDKLFKRLEIELRGMDPAVMNSYAKFVTSAAGHLDVEVGETFTPKVAEKKRYTLLKSAFVHKKHRVQYEIRTYYKFMNFHKLTGSTLSTFLEYIERNLPEGIALKTTKVEILALPEHLKKPPSDLE